MDPRAAILVFDVCYSSEKTQRLVDALRAEGIYVLEKQADPTTGNTGNVISNCILIRENDNA